MTRRQMRFLAPLVLLAYLLAQNGLALLQAIEMLAGHQVVSSWHMSHYDVVVNHDQQQSPEKIDPSCVTSCDQYQHIDFKPLNSAAPDAKSKSLLVLFLALLPTLLVWILPLLRRQVTAWPLFVHRNTLPLLIRSTVLRH